MVAKWRCSLYLQSPTGQGPLHLRPQAALVHQSFKHSGLLPMARVQWSVPVMLLLLLYSRELSSTPARHLCGSQLVDALYSVCGERGFFYGPSRPYKRDLEHLLGFLSKRSRQEQSLWRGLSGHNEPKVKRGIVEQCCNKPCSINHLEGYCN
ncbi:insulin-like [Solea senegalensis]|uniref:Insulin n=1 Tax=Solea senegalensis TaxID=28829 RepID=A0AAV6SNS3_SOLSE|nr:preproinsulin b isoform X1 [Solea senegalensis]KAG7518615.1 insulin-like [Solea senegalensis]